IPVPRWSPKLTTPKNRETPLAESLRYLCTGCHTVWEATCTGIDDSIRALPGRSWAYKPSKASKLVTALKQPVDADQLRMIHCTCVRDKLNVIRIAPVVLRVACPLVRCSVCARV